MVIVPQRPLKFRLINLTGQNLADIYSQAPAARRRPVKSVQNTMTEMFSFQSLLIESFVPGTNELKVFPGKVITADPKETDLIARIHNALRLTAWLDKAVRGKIHWRGGSFAPVEPLVLGTTREVANARANKSRVSAGAIGVSPISVVETDFDTPISVVGTDFASR